MLESLWVWIFLIVQWLVMVVGIAVLCIGIWRWGRWARWFEVLALRWVLVVWLVVRAVGYFVNMVLAMTYDHWAGLVYLRRPGAVDVTLAEIAKYLARDAAWGVGILILALGLWRWTRLAQWAFGGFLVWLMFSGIWGLVRSAIRWLEFAIKWDATSLMWSWLGQMLLMRGGELLLIALMLLWLVHPRVRARFAEGGALRAAV